jgi:hypothetical protein
MNQIVFKTLASSGEVKRLGSARMMKGKVKIEFKDPRVMKELELDRIIADGQVLTPKDGVDYLLALPLEFAGSRLWAEVEEV